jgi:hypothetical protein
MLRSIWVAVVKRSATDRLTGLNSPHDAVQRRRDSTATTITSQEKIVSLRNTYYKKRAGLRSDANRLAFFDTCAWTGSPNCSRSGAEGRVPALITTLLVARSNQGSDQAETPHG